MKILIIDNYDSFTYNIAHIIKRYPSAKVRIIKADKTDLSEVQDFDKIIFSPGPDLPKEGGPMETIIRAHQENKSILGICLGLQAIVLFYGGKLLKLNEVVHGRTRIIHKASTNSILLKDLPDSFEAGLYHSWIADKDSLPDCLEVTCYSSEGRIMGVRHKANDVEAVQFHPESIMTSLGEVMLFNWLGF